MKILLPLADGEQQRRSFKSEVIKLYTSDLEKRYQSNFYSEVGKLITFSKMDIDDDTVAFIQNRRFFKNLDDLTVNEDEVILAPEENLGGLNILSQFNHCHPKSSKIYKDILKKLNVNEKILNLTSFSPHNIFVADKMFLVFFGSFIDSIFRNYDGELTGEKTGAWICERLLHVFAHQFYNVRTEPIEVLSKLHH